MSKITIIPPHRQEVATRNENAGHLPTITGFHPGGVIDSFVTRREAARHERVFRALAARTQSELQLLDAQSAATDAYVRRERAAAHLAELPELLAWERNSRRAERAEELRELQHRHHLSVSRRETERLQMESARVQAQQALDAQQRYGHAQHELAWKRQHVTMLHLDVSAAERQHILDEYEYEADDDEYDDGDHGDDVLDTLYRARAHLLAQGFDTSAVDESIAQQKRARGPR